jgi:hypothetical protein
LGGFEINGRGQGGGAISSMVRVCMATNLVFREVRWSPRPLDAISAICATN